MVGCSQGGVINSGAHTHFATGLITIRYSTGRSACHQFACSLHSTDYPRPRLIGCQSHHGEQECHILPPIPTLIVIVRAQHALASAFHMRNKTTSRERAFLSSHSAHHKNSKRVKTSTPRLPSTADPWPLTGPHAHLAWTPAPTHARLSCSAPREQTQDLAVCNLSLTLSTNQPPLPSISDTNGLAGKMSVSHARHHAVQVPAVHCMETDTTVSELLAELSVPHCRSPTSPDFYYIDTQTS
jgi:hypothetical protein